MDDLERYEPLQGDAGAAGSTYRLVPKRGKMVFTATVLERDLPHRLRLRLVASNVTVLVTGTLSGISSGETRLTSQEDFKFSGPFGWAIAFIARRAIRKAHRHHMEAFKRFAESELKGGK
jgi:hypothetical protein